MVRVRILIDFMVSASSSMYVKGWEGEVSNELADRHGPEGTGFLELIADVKPKTEPKKDNK
ncbi:hypothetical protein [Pedobacter nyackensis]|nr:hypothetical protein [Pedobacter nyackensis]